MSYCMFAQIAGYILTSIVSPLVTYFVAKHTTTEVGVAVGAGVATVGGRVLHICEPPAKTNG